jgi:hypothetical protein
LKRWKDVLPSPMKFEQEYVAQKPIRKEGVARSVSHYIVDQDGLILKVQVGGRV